jgi:hypothetical protein
VKVKSLKSRILFRVFIEVFFIIPAAFINYSRNGG